MLTLYRRIYVLRHQRRSADADALHHTQFEPALQELKQSGHFHEDDLDNRFQLEKRRLEEAALMAELVASMISSPSSPEKDASRVLPSEEVTNRKDPPPASNPVRSKTHASPITAYIDEMLSQNKSPGNRSTGSVANR